MRKILLGALACGLALANPLSAQRTPRRQALMRDIETMFVNQLTRDMALAPDQVAPFRRVVSDWAQKRGVLEARERDLRQALQGQLRPGVAANADSVAAIVDDINVNRVAYATTFGGEMHDLTPILTPVQRGQFQMARDRLLQRIRDLQQQRARGGAGGNGDGSAPPGQ